MGELATAFGLDSVALGQNADAQNGWSVSIGNDLIASGNAAVALI